MSNTTNETLLANSAAYCLANPGVRLRISNVTLGRAKIGDPQLYEWGRRNGLELSDLGDSVCVVFGETPEPDPRIPKHGTPVRKLHPGNRLRLP